MDNLIKVLYRPNKAKDRVRKLPLTEQEFMLLLRIICHPQISQRTRDLALIVKTLTSLLFKLAEMNEN